MVAQDYGLTVYAHGVVLHSDRRVRVWDEDGVLRVLTFVRTGGRRDRVSGFSRASRRNLAMVAANASGRFRSHLTLTYRALAVSGEDEGERNLRIVRRAKRDLNRFLSATRREIGRYVWVMEFQRRGVVHFHALCEHEIAQERVALAWCRSTGELGDVHAEQHAALVESIRDERAARNYVGRYLGKVDQKSLPPGVAAAGRWWGRSKGLEFVELERVLGCEAGGGVPVSAGVCTLRGVRRWLRGELGWKFAGGAFVSWGDRLVPRLLAVVRQLRARYGEAKPWGNGVDEAEGGAR